jgi:hypothetical protein
MGVPCDQPSARGHDVESHSARPPLPTGELLRICNHSAANPAILRADIDGEEIYPGRVGIKLAYVTVPDNRAVCVRSDRNGAIGVGDLGLDVGKINHGEVGMFRRDKHLGGGVVTAG